MNITPPSSGQKSKPCTKPAEANEKHSLLGLVLTLKIGAEEHRGVSKVHGVSTHKTVLFMVNLDYCHTG
jgi:hypothetical protein